MVDRKKEMKAVDRKTGDEDRGREEVNRLVDR